MSGFYTDSEGKLIKFAEGNVGLQASMPVGSIFPSAIPIIDRRIHVLDGTTISQEGIYQNFAILINALILAGHNISCTQDEFDNDVATYGQCGKFVVDNDAKTIRLPLITEFIASNNGGKEIGLTQLDEFKSHTHIQNAHSHTFSGTNKTGSFSIRGAADGASWADQKSLADGVFSLGNVGKKAYIINGTSKQYNTGLESIKFSMTPSGTVNSSTATNKNAGGEETRPKNVRYPYYIVLASGFKTSADIIIDPFIDDVEKIKSKYVKSAIVEDDVLKITDQNNNTVEFQGGGGGSANVIWKEWS